MQIKRKQSGAFLIIGTLVLILAAVFATAPFLKYTPIVTGKIALRYYLDKVFDLSGAEPFNPVKISKKIIPAMIKGDFPAPVDELIMDIKFKHFRKIMEDRQKALKEGILYQARTFPAELEFEGKKFKAKVRLKGDLEGHWIGPDRWSFRVKLQDGKAIKGFKQFSLQRPSTRQLPYDQMYQAWVRSVGNLSPVSRSFKVQVNGIDWGIMLAEEHMSNSFLELNRRKDAPIFKLGSEQNWVYDTLNAEIKNKPMARFAWVENKLYNEKKYRNDQHYRALFSYAIKLVRDLQANRIKPETVLNLSAFSNGFISALAWNESHTLAYSNSRFYINPYTLKIEPITTDQGGYSDGKGLIEDDGSINEASHFSIPDLYQKAAGAPSFALKAEASLQALKEKKNVLIEERQSICQPFPFDCSVKNLQIVDDNLERLEQKLPLLLSYLAKKNKTDDGPSVRIGQESIKLDPVIPFDQQLKFPDFTYSEYNDNGDLFVYNLLPYQVVLTSVKGKCRKDKGAGHTCDSREYLEKPAVIKPGTKGGVPNFVRIKLADDAGQVPLLNNEMGLVVTTKLKDQKKKNQIKLTRASKLFNPLRDQPTVLSQLKDYPFIKVDGDRIVVSAGEWTIKSPLIIPEGFDFHLKPGVTLHFAEQAYLLVKGSLIAEGAADAPIKLVPLGPSWKGLYVLNEGAKDAPSSLRHVVVKDTDFLRDGVLSLTGGVTFYQSSVNFDHVTFAGSIAEDALNLVRSTFSMQNVLFENTKSDAFDSDFSKGILQQIKFMAIGGDGLDTSGSDIKGVDLQFRQIHDKAVSVGEASVVALNNIVANDVGTGVVSKDLSRLEISGLTVTKAKLAAGMAYQKKNHYGPATLTITETEHVPTDFKNQLNSHVLVNGMVVEPENINVKGLYRHGLMRKIKG